MSILAVVTVYECNLCRINTTVSTIAYQVRFEQQWYAGLFVQLCPECRNLPDATPLILEDVTTRDEMTKAITVAIKTD